MWFANAASAAWHATALAVLALLGFAHDAEGNDGARTAILRDMTLAADAREGESEGDRADEASSDGDRVEAEPVPNKSAKAGSTKASGTPAASASLQRPSAGARDEVEEARTFGMIDLVGIPWSGATSSGDWEAVERSGQSGGIVGGRHDSAAFGALSLSGVGEGGGGRGEGIGLGSIGTIGQCRHSCVGSGVGARGASELWKVSRMLRTGPRR